MPPLRMALSFSAEVQTPEDGPLSEESKGRPGEVKQPLFAAAFHNPWVTICCGDGSVGSGSGAGGASHSAERNPPRILPVGSLTTTSAPDEPAPRGIPAGCLADQTEDHSHPPADQPAPRGIPAGCLADPTEDDPRVTLTPLLTPYQAFLQPWWPQGGQGSGTQGGQGVTTEPAGRRFTICAAITIQYRS